MAFSERNASPGSARGLEGPARPWDQDGPADYSYNPRGLKDYAERALDVLQRRKWFVLAACVLVLSGVAAYTYTQAPLYRTSGLVMVSGEDRQQQSGAPQYGPNDPFARDDRSIQNELIVLRNSEALQKGVAERLLQQKTVPGTGQPISLLAVPDSVALTVERVAATLPGYVQFSPAGREVDVIRITASSTRPAEAALLANLYIEEYLELTQQASRARFSASREFLEQQVEKRQQDLQAIERRIQQYKSREGAVALDEEGQYLVNRIAQVEADRGEAQVELRMREASLKSLREELATIRPDQLSRRVGSALEQEIEALQSKIAELELSKRQLMLQADAPSAADSTQAAQIQRRIRSLRAEADSLSNVYVDQVMAAGGLSAEEGVQRVRDLKRQIAEKQIDVTGLKARIDVLGNRLQEYSAELRSIPEQSMEVAQLERSRSYTERMYQFVVEQLQQTRIQEESMQGYANSIMMASIPSRPVQPQPQRNLILGLIFGLLFGLGLAVARDRLDNRLYKPDALREKGYRMVGVVPNLTPLIRQQFGWRSTVEKNGQQLATSIVTAVKPQSAAAEAYRHVRTNVQFSLPDTVIETLLVTSPGMGDGKSVTAVNLAVVMAQAGRRTLLVDADLRRPKVHELLGVEREPGLTQVLKSADGENVGAQATALENLHVLPAGAGVEDPSELLGTTQFRELLRMVQSHFDLVIIDSPPVLAATDAVLVSTQCDATIMVARAGETTEDELDHAARALSDVGATLIGTLFNGFDVSMAYGYKLRYRHYTRYGPYDGYHTSSGASVPA